MPRKFTVVCITLLLLMVAWASPKGTAPRSSASDYPAHLQQDGIGIGARLLTAKDVRKTFVSNLNSCCAVVEVAVFPKPGVPLSVSLDDFTLSIEGTDKTAKASSPTIVSAALQKSTGQDRDVTVRREVGVGYQSGPTYDPATGAVRGGGTYTEAGVGVGIGGSGNASGTTEKERSVIETELREKGLQEGESADPLAGYVYFQIAGKKSAKYQLRYRLNGNTVELNLR